SETPRRCDRHERESTARADRARYRSGSALSRDPKSARRAASSGGGGFSDCWDRTPPNRERDVERRPRIRSRESSSSASCHRFRSWHFAEQTEEIFGGLTRNFFERDPASLRQHLGN